MRNFSFEERRIHLRDLETQVFDLLIIGGGINGAGAARDAALRGMSVGLIEARDFASGTSSRSSKLIHGGIRYLENLDFKLVFEALGERSILFEMAPHLVHPLRFLIPLYKNSRVTMNKMGLGMWLYDLLALFQTPEMHERLDSSQSIERIPFLKADDLVGSFVYSDAYMDDDRLVLETLRSAHEAGAKSVNHVSAIGAEFDSKGQIQKVLCEDSLSQRKFYIRAKQVLSSVGPWTDLLATSFDPQWKKVLRPTKGIHLTFSKDRLPIHSAVVMAAEKSDRIVFAIPRHEMVIVGTTDTDDLEPPENVRTTSEDVKYLLKILESYFPGARLQEKDIVSCYAGIRPLVKDQSGTPGKTSREHSIFTDPHGITYVVGGKYTTYRRMAHEVLEHILRRIPIEEKTRFARVDTAQPLNSFTGFEEYRQALLQFPHWKRNALITESEVRLLTERFGLEAEILLKRYPELSAIQIEAAHAIQSTMCFNLVDFYRRRVPLFLSERDHGLSTLIQVSQVFQNYLGWSPSEKAEQEQLFKAHIQSEMNWRSK